MYHGSGLYNHSYWISKSDQNSLFCVFIIYYWVPIHPHTHYSAMQLSVLVAAVATLSSFSSAQPLHKRETTEHDLGLNAAGFFDKYGYPGPIPKENLLIRDAYISAPNYATRNPYWSVEHINKEAIKTAANVNRDKSKFKEEDEIPELFRAKLKDYYKSGYDRGHQAPAGDVQFAQDALDQTFYLSNMAPQVGKGFNRNYWAWTEEFPRNLTGTYDSVRILTGPLYLPEKASDGTYTVSYKLIGNPPNVAVPTHFFKVVVGENENSKDSADAAAFVLPNKEIDDSTKLTDFQTSFDDLSRDAGLSILTNVTSGITVNDLCKKVSCETHKYSHDRYSSGSSQSKLLADITGESY